MINNNNFINAIYKDITIVKGDTCIFGFELEGLEDTPTFTFKCNETPEGSTYFSGVVSLESSENGVNTYSVYISPSKTNNMDIGRYYYDLNMTIGTNVYTLMRGRFELVYNVE